MEKVVIQREIFQTYAMSCHRKHATRPYETVHDAI